MLSFLGDLKFAWRSLRRAPTALAVTVLSLGFGIGVVTASVALVNRLLFLPPAGLSEPKRLASLYSGRDDGGLYGSSSYADYHSMVEGLEAIEDAAAMSIRTLALAHDERSVPIFGEEVTGNFFELTGIRPVVGRGFLPAEADLGNADSVVVLGNDLWRSQFASDPSVVGKTVRLDGRPFTVIGIAPDGVTSRRVPLEPDVWIPLGIADGSARSRTERFEDRDSRTFSVLARLRPDADLEQLQAQAQVLAARLAQEYSDSWQPEERPARTITAVSERGSRLNPRAQRLLFAVGAFFVGVAGLVLLIAGTNVTSVFLARALERSREMAVRVSLGASRRRLVRLLLVEGLIPGLAAGVVGIAVAWSISRSISSWSLPINLPIRLEVPLDSGVLLFAAILSVGASLLFGLAPALAASRWGPVSAFKGDTAAVLKGRGRFGMRKLLVIVQCAAALVLVVGASLFSRALQSATALDLGLSPEGVAIASRARDPRDHSLESSTQYFRELKQRLSANPAVEAVSLARSVELTLLQIGAAVEIEVDGIEATAGASTDYFRNSVTPGYHEMLEIPLLEGRTFLASDRSGAPLVAVVNETFANRFWPGESALGKSFRMTARDPLAPPREAVSQSTESLTAGNADPARSFEVVGVARDGKYLDFDDPPTPYLWTALDQDPSSTVVVLVEGRKGAEEMVSVLLSAMELEPGEVQQVPPSTLADQLSIQFIHLRIASRVLRWGGGFGLLLAAIGIYGTVALSVKQRRRETAIRIAVGARRDQVMRSLAGDGLLLAVVGLAAGLLVVIPAAGLLRSILAGVSPADPVAVGGGVAVLLVSALLATLLPARSATRVDPVTALREE